MASRGDDVPLRVRRRVSASGGGHAPPGTDAETGGVLAGAGCA
jgi:hypothetical protein